MSNFPDVFLKEDWEVKDASLHEGQDLVKKYHYSKGGSNTRVYMHGLYYKPTGELCGVAWWVPPTRTCCESVNKDEWRKVLTLTRLVIIPNVPKNACSFLLAKSINIIKKEGRFVSLVTYADEAMKHTGAIYKASNWEYIGKVGPYPNWVTAEGMQKSEKVGNHHRNSTEMRELGCTLLGKFYKHKFVMHLK